MNTAEEYRISKLKSLKTGDTVYVIPNDTRSKPFTTEILSVGNRWLKLNYMHRSENKFDVMNDYRHTPDIGSSSYDIHASEEDYKIYCDKCEEHIKLLQQVEILKVRSDIDILKKVIKRWDKLISRQHERDNSL